MEVNLTWGACFRCLIIVNLTWIGLQFPSLILFSWGTYTNELELYGQNSAPMIILAIFLVSVFSSGWLVSSIINKRRSRLFLSIAKLKGLRSIILLSIFVYGLPVFWYGPAFISNLDRYEFNALALASPSNFLKNYIVYFIFLYWVLCPDKKSSVIFYSLTFLVLMILRGEKFSGQIMLLSFLLGGAIANRSISSRVVGPFVWLTIGAAIFVALIFLLYTSDQYGHDATTAWQAIEARIAKQGQLLFYFIINSDSLDSVSLLSGLNYFSHSPLGMTSMMEAAMPIDLFLAKTGSLTGGFPAVLWYAGLDSILLAVVLFVALNAALTGLLILGIRAFSRLPVAYMPLCLLLTVYPLHLGVKVFGSGDLYLLTSPFLILGVAALCIILLIGAIGFDKKRIYCHTSQTRK